MIISTIRLAIPAEKHNDALRIIKPIALQSRDYPGCLSYNIQRDVEDSDVLTLQSNWDAKEDLYRHVRSEEYRNLLLVVEMSRKQPEIRFDTVSSSTGIETIEKIRNTVSGSQNPRI